MIPEGELGLISSWSTPTTLDLPYYTILLYCMILDLNQSFGTVKAKLHPYFQFRQCVHVVPTANLSGTLAAKLYQQSIYLS